MNPDWAQGPPHLVTVQETSRKMNIYDARRTLDAPMLSIERRSRFSRESEITDARGALPYTLEQTRRYLYTQYVLRAPGHPDGVWRLSTQSAFKHRHTLKIADGRIWNIRTPFYTVHATAHESGNLTMIAQVHTAFVWDFWFRPDTVSVPIAVASALLHAIYASS